MKIDIRSQESAFITMKVNSTNTEPKRGDFYLAFDTAWFSAFYTSKGLWIYNGREINPTHWMELPEKPIKD